MRISLWRGDDSPTFVGSCPFVDTGIATETDSKGEWEFASVAPAVHYIVRAEAPGLAAGRSFPFGVRAGEVRLLPTIIVDGGDAIGGVMTTGFRPIESATVELWSEDPFVSPHGSTALGPNIWRVDVPLRMLDRTRTTSEGQFSFRHVPRGGRIELVVRAFGYVTLHRRLFRSWNERGADGISWNVVVPEAAPFEGQVTSSENEPIFGARVRIGLVQKTSEASGWCFHEVATTDSKGRFRFDAAPTDGEAFVEIGGPGLANWMGESGRITITPSTFRVGRGPLRVARVVDRWSMPISAFDLVSAADGERVAPDEGLHAGRSSRESDGLLTFPFGGNHEYILSADGFAPVSLMRSLWKTDAALATDSAQSVDVMLWPGSRLTGALVDSNLRPIADAAISVWRSPSPSFRVAAARTTADGSFELGLLAPGEYEVEFIAPGYSRLVQRHLICDGIHRFDLGRLTLKPSCDLECVAFSRSRTRNLDICVTLRPEALPIDPSAELHLPLEPDGVAHFFGIADGDWRVVLEPFRSPGERGCETATEPWRVETVCCVRAGDSNRVEIEIP